MKAGNFLTKIANIVIALVITLSTSGVTVFIHHCNHSHTTTSSLFIDLSRQLEKSSEIKSQRCCCAEKKITNSGISAQSCCSKYSHLVRLTSDNVPVKSYKKGTMVARNVQEFFETTEPYKEPIFKVPAYSAYHLKADRAGKALVIRLCQFKICGESA
jgi:hypothetical protein